MSIERLQDVNRQSEDNPSEPTIPANPQDIPETVPYYALSEEQVRAEVDKARADVAAVRLEAERRKRAGLEYGEGKQAPLFLIIETPDDRLHKEGRVEEVDKARVMAEAEAPYRERAGRLWRQAERVHETIVDPASWLSIARQPFKLANFVRKGLKAEHILDRGWNAAVIAGIEFERMLAAAMPYVPSVDVSETVRSFLDGEKKDKSKGIAPAKEKLEQPVSAQTETLVRDLKLDAQLGEQLQILLHGGLLQQLSSGEMGILDDEGNEYAAPTLETVKTLVERRRSLIDKKASQGFTRMLLVPQAVSPERQAEVLKRSLLDHLHNGQLHDAYGKAARLENDLLFTSEFDLLGSKDDLEQLKDKPRKGKQQPRVAGWKIVLVKNMPEIPRRPEEVVSFGGRGEFVMSDRSAARSQELLDQSAVCAGEQGFSLPAWLAYASSELERSGTVVDYHGSTFLLGSQAPGHIFIKGKNIPWIGWSSKYKRSDIRALKWGKAPPRTHQFDIGIRTMVEIS